MRKRTIIMLCSIMLILSGCGAQKGQIAEEEFQALRDYTAEYQSQNRVDIVQTAWQEQGVIEEAETVYKLESFQSPVFAGAEGRNWDIGSAACCGRYARIYMKDYVGNNDGLTELEYFVDLFDVNALQAESYHYTFGADEACPFAFDDSGSCLYGLLERRDAEELVDEVKITELLPDGTLGRSIELTNLLQERNLIPTKYVLSCEFHICEEKQVIYFIPQDENMLLVLNMEGKLIREYSEFDGNSISFWTTTPEGDSIFVAEDKAGNRDFFCWEEEGLGTLYKPEGGIGAASEDIVSCDIYGNVLYPDTQGHLVNWNVASGKKEKVIPTVSNHIRPIVMAARNEEGKIVVLRDDAAGLSLNVYSQSGPFVNAEITLETSGLWDSYFVELLQKFEQSHPGITIHLGEEVMDAGQQIKTNQIYADIANGGGPDVICLDYWGVERFVDGNALLDLTGTVEEQQLLGGLLDVGKYDGKQFYFPITNHITTYAVRKSVWDKPTWTVEEVLDLLEQKQQSNADYLLIGGSSSGTLLEFFLSDLANSPFIDSKTMTAHFDAALFGRVLECCKQQDALSRRIGVSDNHESHMKRMLAGEQLAVECYPTFRLFSETAAGLEDDYNFVGVPTDGDSGNFNLGFLGLVVNRNTQKAEAIKELLQYLYSYEACRTSATGIPMRSDILENVIVENPGWSGKGGVYFEIGYRAYSEITCTKRDGSSFKKEYREFLDSVAPKNVMYDDLKTMIQEEAAYYFNGAKTVREVQEVIQNRASLYLSEQ